MYEQDKNGFDLYVVKKAEQARGVKMERGARLLLACVVLATSASAGESLPLRAIVL